MAEEKSCCDNKFALNADFDKAILVLEMRTCYHSAEAKATASQWITKLKMSGETLDEMRLRNDITRYLIEKADRSVPYPPPFNKPPKTDKKLMDIVKTLPSDMKFVCPTDETRNYIVEMFNNSPDHGQFLSNQPVPKNGTFCFLILRKANTP